MILVEQYKEGCRFARIWSGRDSAIQRGHCKMLALPAGLLVSQIKVSIVYPELSNKGQNYRLLHFIVGASNFQRPQSFMGSSHGVNCTGSEQSIAECTKNMEAADGSCGGFASYVRCHNASSCLDTEEESTTTTQPTPSDGTNAKHATTSDSSDPNSSTTLADPNSSTTLADTEPTKPTTEQLKPFLTETKSSSFFKPPTLYYFTGGLSAIIILALFIVTMLITSCLFCYKKSTKVSKKQVKNRDIECKTGQPISGSICTTDGGRKNKSNSKHIPSNELAY